MTVSVDREDLSFWAGPPDRDPHPPLRGQHRCDVAVVGGGYTGLAAAHRLATEGRDVVLLEAHAVGSGASGRNTGIVRPGVGGTVLDLVRRHGEDVARSLYAASVDAVRAVCALAADVGCDLEPVPHVKVALTEAQARLVRAEADLLARLGFRSRLRGGGLPGAVAGLEYPDSAQLNPVLLARGMERRALAAGARMHERTPVRRLRPDGRRVTLDVDGGSLQADRVVLATNGYTERLGVLTGRVVPLQTHVGVTEPLTPSQREALPWAGRRSFADKRHVFDYFRVTRDGRLVFGGGKPLYRPGRADIADPRVWARQRAAVQRMVPGVRVAAQWSGTMGMTLDRFPVIGEVAPGVVFAGGWSGHGVALAAASGALVTDLVLGRDNALAALPWHRATAPWLPPDPARAAGLAAYVAALHLADRAALARQRHRPLDAVPRERTAWTS